MFPDMSKIREAHLSPTAFSGMYHLKYLIFYYSDSMKRERKVYLPEQGVESLPDEICLLYWDDYPSKSLPSNFCAENLVELSMPNSRIERLWNGVQNLENLKRLDLRNSQNLIIIPDLSLATKLERMMLDGCTRLVEVASIQYLNKLWLLSLRHCQNLGNFPSNIHLRSLRVLILIGCSNVTEFPHISGNLEILCLGGTAIQEVPSSIEHLVGLIHLQLDDCKKLNNLPNSISKLKSLAYLYLKNCPNIHKFPKIPRNLEILDLSGTAIEQVPSSIECLSQLLELSLDNRAKVEDFQELIYMSSLRELDLSGINFETIPAGIKQLLEQEMFYLNFYKRLQFLPAPHLLYLDADHCRSLHLVSRAPDFFVTWGRQLMFSSVSSMWQNQKEDWNQVNIDLVKKKLSIQDKAVKLYHNKGPDVESSLSKCFLGGYIPGCFCRPYGSRREVHICAYLCADKLVDFGVTVAEAFEDFIVDLRGFNVECRCYFKASYYAKDGVCHYVSCLFPWDEHPRFIGSNLALFCYNFNVLWLGQLSEREREREKSY